MNHNYKLTDFRRMQGEADIAVYEGMVSVDLRNIRELPITIVDRLETIVNRTIVDYEQANSMIIPLDDMEIDMRIGVYMEKKELFLQVFINYSIADDCLCINEIISSADKDYRIIKEHFMSELNHFVFGD